MRAVLALACVLLLAACGGDDDATPARPATTGAGATATATTAAATTAAPSPGDALGASCTNDEYGFSIRYPAEWHTNEGDVLPPCSFFHPEPFEVPRATSVVDVAVMTRREPVPLETIAGESPAAEMLEREERELAGRDGLLQSARTTGEGLLPAGIEYTQLLVSLDAETLVLETYDVEGLDYARNREVLEQMGASLELAGS